MIIPGSASPLTMEALLALAEFVKNPQYIDRIKQLQDAQKKHDAAKAAADVQLGKVLEAQERQDREATANMSIWKQTDARHQKEAADLTKRETAVLAREATLVQRMKDQEDKDAAREHDLDARDKAISASEHDLDLREAQVKQREDAVAARETKMDRKEALHKQAEAV
jgi:hypothetical protein